MPDSFQPYIGPRPFEREDAEKGRFFGRNREASELLSRIIAHSAVLFYSQSGAGKTSLINAKLIPMLEKRGFEILKPARVRGLRPQNIKREEIRNLYVFNVLRSWDTSNIDPRQLTETSIGDFLTQRARPTNKDGDKLPYIAIFDQSEELFTFYQERWEDRQDFFEQVGDALEEDRLMRVLFVMREDYIAELDPYLPLLPEKLRTRYRLERLKERAALRAVTGPLEETEYSFAEGVAEQLVNDLLMVPVETPTGVVQAKGEFVEPVQLQVVCQSLWENCQLSWQGLKPSEPKIITQEHLDNFGDVDAALSSFYENAIKKVVQSTGINEGKLRTWFENTLITPTGTRGTVFRGQEETGGIPTDVVDELVNQHIIMGEIRGGSKWLELTHDRLIEPIRVSNEQWRLQYSGGEQTRKLLEDRAAKWVRNGRSNNELLDEGEFLEAKRWLETPMAAEVGYSFPLLALVQASRAALDESARIREQALAAEQHRRAEAERERAEEQQRRAEAEKQRAEEKQRRIEGQTKSTRRLRWLAAALAVMFLLTAAFAARARYQGKQAALSAERAEKSADDARKAREQAEEQRKVAESAKLAADQHAEDVREAYDKLQQTNQKLATANKKVIEESRRAALQRQIAVAQAKAAEVAKKQAQDAREQAINEAQTVNRLNALLQTAVQVVSVENDALRWQSENTGQGLTKALAKYQDVYQLYSYLKFLEGQRRVLTQMVNISRKLGNSSEEQKAQELLDALPLKTVIQFLRETIREDGIESAVNQYRELKRAKSDKIDFNFTENEFNTFGYELLRDKKVKEAIEIFKLNCEAYPQSSNTYDSLGEAYMIAGNKELAIQNYEKSLKLDPSNTNAVEKLKQLRAGK